jgi:hypothetical protein
MLTDERKILENVGALVGFPAARCRTKVFRHTYCSTRLQTLDNGHPVSPWTVAKELGHGGRSLVDRVYGHLGEIRHRSEHVEYRVQQHEETLGERLTVLQAAHRESPQVTGIVTGLRDQTKSPGASCVGALSYPSGRGGIRTRDLGLMSPPL